MAEKRAKRKLSAILSADVKGYSRLMGEDELSTVETLKEYREIIGNLVMDYQGRVIDSPGDNILSEFSSVVDAVECGVKIQEELKAKNSELPEHRRMEFRIGVNLGDVLEDESRIYGDGVNVAARVEGLAEGGGVCISGTAFDQIGRKLPFGYEFLGEQEVKNIEKPVRVYRVLTDEEHAGKVIGVEPTKPKRWRWAAVSIAIIVLAGAWAIWNFHFRPPPIESASVERMAFPLPDEPSIAVLPFTNMSGDPEQDYFVDGFTEQIIASLSKVPRMLVIARNSTFAYKGKSVKVQQVSEDLGVRYVLEGSLQKSGDHVRITAQLIDAMSGNHVWAEKYDRDLKDIFAIYDEVTMKILTALQINLTEGETARLLGKSTANLEAYLKVLKGIEHVFRWNKEDNAIGRQLYEEAIALDPKYTGAYVALAWTYNHDASRGWSKNPAKSLDKAIELAQKAVTLDDSDAYAHAGLSAFYGLKGRFEEAIEEGKKAVTLDPNGADTNAVFAITLYSVGRYEEAIDRINRAIRLNPVVPNWYNRMLYFIYKKAGRLNEVIEIFKKIASRYPEADHSYTFQYLGVAYRDLGEYEEAVKVYKKAISHSPNYVPAYVLCSSVLSMSGNQREAISMIKTAINLRPETYHFTFLSEYYRRNGQYEEAIDTSKRVLDRDPTNQDAMWSYVTLICALSKLGREEEASAAATELHRKNPKFLLELEQGKTSYTLYSMDNWFHKNKADKDLLVNALRKAELRDRPMDANDSGFEK